MYGLGWTGRRRGRGSPVGPSSSTGFFTLPLARGICGERCSRVPLRSRTKSFRDDEGSETGSEGSSETRRYSGEGDCGGGVGVRERARGGDGMNPRGGIHGKCCRTRYCSCNRGSASIQVVILNRRWVPPLRLRGKPSTSEQFDGIICVISVALGVVSTINSTRRYRRRTLTITTT